jgi:hypothetical protein
MSSGLTTSGSSTGRLTARRALWLSPCDPVRDNALSPRARNSTADIRVRAGARTTRTLPAGHGRLRAPNIHPGIATPSPSQPGPPRCPAAKRGAAGRLMTERGRTVPSVMCRGRLLRLAGLAGQDRRRGLPGTRCPRDVPSKVPPVPARGGKRASPVQGVLRLEPPGRSAGDMTCFVVERGPALAVRRAGARLVRGLLADAAVDPLTEQVGVAEVPGVLLDHVEYHLAQCDGSAVLHGAADGEVG